MLQKKLSSLKVLSKLKKLTKKQKVILSSVIVVFSCLGATVMSQANSVSVEVMSCEVQQTNMDIAMSATEGEIPYVVWVEDNQETTQSSESESIAYFWTSEILSDIQIADLLTGITKKYELMDATYFADENEKNKFSQSLSNSENIEFVFVKGENMVMALGDAKLYVQATSIKLETENDAKFTKGFYKINENYVDVNNSTTIVDEATTQESDSVIQDATVETTPVQDETTEVKTGSGEQLQTGQQTTTTTTNSTTSITTTTSSDEIPLDSSIEARNIREELEEKNKEEAPLDSSTEARKIRQEIEEKNNAEIPLDSSTEARKIRQEYEKKNSSTTTKTGSSSTKTTTSSDDEIPLDSSTQARKIRQENATKTTSKNNIKDADVVVENKTSSSTTKTTTPAATTPETRAKVRQERVENIKKESQKVTTKVKEAIPVAKEKAKTWGKKAYDFIMHGPF